jgi:hypothetical protein
MPSPDQWTVLFVATVFAIVLVTVPLALYFVAVRIAPVGVRIGRVLGGVWAAIEMNWREVARRLARGTAVAETWAAEQRRLRAAKHERRFPVETLSTAANTRWFHVRGVDRATERDVEEVIDAQTAENANAKATLRGILVTEVTAIEPAEQS